MTCCKKGLLGFGGFWGRAVLDQHLDPKLLCFKIKIKLEKGFKSLGFRFVMIDGFELKSLINVCSKNSESSIQY